MIARRCLPALLVLLLAGSATAQQALVLTLRGFSLDTEMAADELTAILDGLGYTAEVRDPAAGDPIDDIDDFSCVFDVRPELAFLPPDWFDDEAMTAALLAGRGVLYVGEHRDFAQRNEAIAEVIETLGGGPLAFDDTPLPFPVVVRDIVEPLNPAHPLAAECNPVTELVYDGIDNGRFTETGTGTFVTGAPDAAGAVAWDRGDLPVAPDARLLVVLDINALSPLSTLDYRVEPPPGTVPTENRVFLVNGIGWLCGSPGEPDRSPCVFECKPRNHGFWHRWCLGQDAIDPGRFGHGRGPFVSPRHLEVPAETLEKADAAMAPFGISACDALDDGPFSDERLAALREMATIHLNIAAGMLSLGCPVELHPIVRGDEELTVRDAIGLMNERLGDGSRRALREARWIGAHVVNGEALLRTASDE
jgi:hypothetical protein